MFSLVRFDNDDYYVTPTKRVKIIEKDDCLVKYKGGTKYHATLIKTTDSDEELRELMKRLEAELQVENGNTNESPKIKSVPNSRNHSYELRGGGCSTPIDGALLTHLGHQTTFSDILDDKRASTSLSHISQSVDSSAPHSGCSAIINVVGESWVENLGKTVDLEGEGYVRLNNPESASLNQNFIEERVDAERDVHKTRNNEEKQDYPPERDGNEKRDDNVQSANEGGDQNELDEEPSVGEGKADPLSPGENEQRKHYKKGLAEEGSNVEAQKNNEQNHNASDDDGGIENDDESDKNDESYNQESNKDDGSDTDESDNDDELQIDYRQYDEGNEDHTDDENDTDKEDDDVEKDSDYIPEQSTSKSSSFQVSRVNMTKNLSQSCMTSLPVDIRFVNVPASKNGTQKTSKKNFCPYCKKLFTKFARHIESRHKSEADVARFIKLPKGTHERRKIIETIRKHGNFLHNTDSNMNTGILITCRQRQSQYDRTVEDYVCCSNCKGFFSKQTLRLHSVKCNELHKKGVRHITVLGRRLAGYIHEVANPVLRRTVFPVMRDDDVVRSIKYDELIILFGNRLCDKYTSTHQHDMIRAQLRLLGRFKCAIKDIDKEVDDFASIFHPKFYDAAVLAVRRCAKYNSETQIFETPAVATMLGTIIKKCIGRRKAQCIRKQDYEGKKAAEEFLDLFEDDFPTTINKKVLEDQTKQKRQKKIILPSRQDIRQLYDYLKKKSEVSLKTLEKHFDLSAWKVLTECTLILVQIFNRRRAGEIERLLITDYQNQTELDGNVNADLFAKLSEESRNYAKQFARLEIRGKLGRTVPVLLYPLHVACIEMILKYRTEAGVKCDNEYIFSVPNTGRLKKKYLRACALMRKFSQECGAVMPISLRGTTLRKHIATFFAMEGIGENDVVDLANFMGHDKQIHKDVYRVPVPIREVTQVSRLLQAAMGESEDDESSDEASDLDGDLDDGTNNPTTNKEVSWRDGGMSSSANITNNSEDELEESIADAERSEKESPMKRRSTSPYGKTKRIRWSTDEKAAVHKFFGDPAKIRKLPSLAECQNAITKYKVLRNRKPQVLKTWIDNQRKSTSRKSLSQSLREK